jgi:hypothetical protein
MRQITLPHRHIVAVLAVLGTLLAAPAGASALSATIDRACYTNVPNRGSQPIVATITGGTAKAYFVLYVNAPGKHVGTSGSVSGTFDAAGNAVARLTDVFPPSGSVGPRRGERLVISIADYGTGSTPTPVVVGHALITNLAISVVTKPISPRAKRRVRVSGTPFAGKTLYGFITKPGSAHVLRRFRLGTGGVCGYASSRQVLAPPSYRMGHYRLYVNAGSTLRRRRALVFAFRIFTHF